MLFLPTIVGASFPERITTLQDLVTQSRYEEASALGDSLLGVLEKDHESNDASEALVLDQLVQVGYRSGRTMDPAVLAMAERAVDLKQGAYPAGHPAIATSLMQLANLLNERRECSRALDVYDRAIAILQVHEDLQSELAVVLSSCGVAYRRLGRYEEAQRNYEQALAIQERVLGADQPGLASTLNNLANISIQFGDYSQARRAHERALAIREHHFGPDHEWVGETLNNLSTVLGYMGEYVESLHAQEKALAIFRKQLGPDHLRTQYAELNLGIVYLDMGAHDNAVSVFENVLEAVRSQSGPDHIDTIYVLNSLAAAHFNAGRFDEALNHYSRSLGIFEASTGPDNPESVFTVYEIGRCLGRLGRLDEAEKLLHRSLAMKERMGESESPDLCAILNHIAEFDLQRGHPESALHSAARSTGILRTQLGESHPLLAESLAWQARASRAMGRDDDAIVCATDAERIAREHMQATMQVLSETHALGYAENRIQGLDIVLSMLEPIETGDRVQAVWEMLVQARAVVLDEITLRHRRLVRSGTAATDSLMIACQVLRERLSNLVLRGPGWEDIESYHHLVENTRADIRILERELALTDHEGRIITAPETVTFERIRSTLEPGTALVAYVLYLDEPASGKSAGTPTYRAFVLPGPSAEPSTMWIGNAPDIDAAVTAWQDQARLGCQEQGSGSPRGLIDFSNDAETSLAEYRASGTTLRELIWDPIQSRLGNADRVFLVLDGTLHLVNFAALPDRVDRYLVDDDRLLHVLDTERFLAAADHESQSSGILLVGNPAYGVSGKDLPSRSSPALSGINFEPLPHAKAEIEQLRELWRGFAAFSPLDVAVLTGPGASESAFKASASGRRILHIATHGFFVPGGVGRSDIDEPLAFSGLALGGANAWRKAANGAEDGLLTAEEVSSLDLCSVEWAVLSACETGLGSLEARGEGVFGLKRAFTLAGVRTVIMSLWNVDDEATLDWMTALYSSRILDGLDTAEAVRTASRSVLEDRRNTGNSTHPFYWAGFTAAGDWR